MTVLIPLFVLLFLPIVTTQNSSFCISNYAQLKQSLFDESSGNRERLLYAFKPPNRPTPHYLWAHYFHNHSANWSDVLECPQTSVLKACPEENSQQTGSEEWEEIVNTIFWGDSPLLINVDIPLLKIYTLDTLFDFLGDGSCVELVIAPFCSTVNSETRSQLLQYATTLVCSKSFTRVNLCAHAKIDAFRFLF